MPTTHPVQPRRCKSCGHDWLAAKWTRLDAQPPLIAPGFGHLDQALARQNIHQARLMDRKRWSTCPNCGSTRVYTMSRKERAALMRNKQAALQAQQPAQSAQPPDSIPERRPPTPVATSTKGTVSRSAAVTKIVVKPIVKGTGRAYSIAVAKAKSRRAVMAEQRFPRELPAPTAAPGWYVDPLIDPGQLRFWDGARWTNDVRPIT